MKGLRMVEEEGRAGEVLVFHNHFTDGFIGELLEVMPDSTFYVAHGYTSEEMQEEFMRAAEETYMNGNGEALDALMKGEDRLRTLFKFPPRMASELSRVIINDPKELERFGVMQKAYLEEGSFFRAVNLTMEMQGRGQEGMKRSDLEAVKALAPERVHLVPVDGILSSFPRDRVLAATRNGKKLLVQGTKDVTREGGPSYDNYQIDCELTIPYSPFWKGRFGWVRNSTIGLSSFEGGDIRVSRKNAFFGPNIRQDNLTRGHTDQEIERKLKGLTGRETIYLGRGQYMPHLDLFFSPIDSRLMVIGDMNPTRDVMKGKGTWNEDHERAYQTFQRYLDRQEEQLRDMKYLVRRVPLWACQPEVEITMDVRSYTNEIRDGETMVVAALGIEELDEMGIKVMESLGYDIHVTDRLGTVHDFYDMRKKTRSFSRAGVRCCTNILSRK